MCLQTTRLTRHHFTLLHGKKHAGDLKGQLIFSSAGVSGRVGLSSVVSVHLVEFTAPLFSIASFFLF